MLSSTAESYHRTADRRRQTAEGGSQEWTADGRPREADRRSGPQTADGRPREADEPRETDGPRKTDGPWKTDGPQKMDPIGRVADTMMLLAPCWCRMTNDESGTDPPPARRAARCVSSRAPSPRRPMTRRMSAKDLRRRLSCLQQGVLHGHRVRQEILRAHCARLMAQIRGALDDTPREGRKEPRWTRHARGGGPQ